MRDIESKIDNTSPSTSGRLSAAEFGSFIREMETLAASAGLTLDPAFGPDTDLTMLAQAAARYASLGRIGVDTGGANAHVVQPILVAAVLPRAYFDGMEVLFYAGADNTGATTLNAWSLGSKPLLDESAAVLTGGEIKASRLVAAVYSAALASGAGAFRLAPWANQKNLGGGGEGGGLALRNIGDGTGLSFKDASGGFNNIRSIAGANGITATTSGDKVVISVGGVIGGDCVAIPSGIKGANIATPSQHRQTSSAQVVNAPGGTSAMYTTEGSAWQPTYVGEIFYQDFGAPVILHEVEARSDWGVVDATLTAGSLVKSDDSVSWTVVSSVSGLAPNVYITWTVPANTTCARYWGIRVDTLASSVNQWQGGMLKFFERVPA